MLRWIVALACFFALQCRTAQLTTYTIDQSLTPSVPSLEGLDGGSPRPLAVIAGPTGKRTEIVANEVILHPRSQQELDDFRAKYGAIIVRDGSPLIIDPPPSPPTPIEPSGWVLLRIDPSRSELGDLQRSLAAGPLSGQYRFSSDDAARLIALIAREKHLGIGPNIVLHPTAINEHPDGAGGFLDASRFPWMTEDDDPNTSGDQGLSIGVIRAWDYLKYHNLPPTNGSFRPARIAIVDGGFALDPTTGAPLNGNLDWGIGVMQGDVVDHDHKAGGENLMKCGGSPCPWHGTGAFGVAAAEPHNNYGSAGIGGDVVWPLLMRVSDDLYTWADGVRSAVINGADVISVSLAGGCGDFHWFCSIPPDDIYDMNQMAVNLARSWGSMVIGSADNQGVDLAGEDKIPCKLDGVICVGAVGRDKMNVFNFGSAVDIWAPTNIISTVTPETAAQDTNDTGGDELVTFSGVSASVPFIAGVAGLMKALNPNLVSQQVQDILQNTANPSPDPKVAKGYVDAFRAVLAVRANMPPVVQLQSSPSTIPWTGFSLVADVTDPELRPETQYRWPVTVSFASNIDGVLCTTRFAPYRCSSTLSVGQHQITVTATDFFGAFGAATRSVQTINRPPAPEIHEPLPAGQHFAHQPVTLSAFVSDPDEHVPDSGVGWRSDRDGALGIGWTRSATLTEGAHVLTVRAIDMQGAFGEDSVTINVQSGAGLPSVQILDPAPGLSVPPGTQITLRGAAADPEDGALTGVSLVWTSDIDGALGTGETLNVVLSGPPVLCNPEIVIHTVKLSATDSDGNSIEVKVRISVGVIC